MIPIKDTVPRRTFPFVTMAIIAANGLVFLFELALPERTLGELISLFGLIPARYSHPDWAVTFGLPLDTYWPFLTNLFLHGGWLHVIGNMWFLYLFGDNVEDRLGHIRYFLFYLLSGVAANTVHFLANANSTMPVIGASGAIAGVMGAYLRLFPTARIVTLVPILFFPFFFDIPAVFFMLSGSSCRSSREPLRWRSRGRAAGSRGGPISAGLPSACCWSSRSAASGSAGVMTTSGTTTCTGEPEKSMGTRVCADNS